MKLKIGKIVRKYRIESGFTQANLARLIGKSCSYVSCVESDKIEIELSSLYIFAKALNLKIVDILTERIDLYEPGSKKHKEKLKVDLLKDAKVVSDAFKILRKINIVKNRIKRKRL